MEYRVVIERAGKKTQLLEEGVSVPQVLESELNGLWFRNMLKNMAQETLNIKVERRS